MRIIVEPGLALNYLKTDDDIVTGHLDITADIYVISLQTFLQQWTRINDILLLGGRVVIEKTDESVITQWHVVSSPHFLSRMRTGQIRWITGGAAPKGVVNLNSEHFLSATIGSQPHGIPLLDYNVYKRKYSFLFTNRKLRPHRQYLLSLLQQQCLLDTALWCNHDRDITWGHPDFNKIYSTHTVETQSLPQEYNTHASWVDGVIVPEQYKQTWFTLVSETVFESTASFRTEKFYKPVLAGHPFIVCANQGFYQDLRNMGFKTYSNWIDELFDTIEDGQQRIQRLVDTVSWLIKQDLPKFWQETHDVRLYNQQHALAIHSNQHQTFTKQMKDFAHAQTQ
jgi:hypothetical protein